MTTSTAWFSGMPTRYWLIEAGIWDMKEITSGSELVWAGWLPMVMLMTRGRTTTRMSGRISIASEAD